jgi:hypothetical protein
MSQPPAARAWAGACQRQAPRFGCAIETEYAVLDVPDSPPRPARLVNISRGGIAVVVSEPLLPQTTLAVVLSSLDGLFTYLLAGEVIHGVPYRDGWLVGCAFNRLLTADELADLL